ncbi:MAG: hypothetical protein COV47_01425 [Candidatus Diapherotrites archaeon CG11_big_fil_rev_8_21_14_0_20_37_9]|nr:MAG: hypothetical protein COV47_01425 [Candidatus Diapherotrites archaeon CG11_big_fil_rev_8_21_14_0_20_37_9]
MQTNKLFILFALFVLVFPVVNADASYILIEKIGNLLIATKVLDDDGTISRVDLFVTGPEKTAQYAYIDVAEGEIFSVPFTSSSTIAYNFTDVDGQTIGLGSFLIVQLGTDPIGQPVSTDMVNLIKKVELIPRVVEGKSAYYADMLITPEPGKAIDEVSVTYSVTHEGTTGTLIPYENVIFDGSKYHATFGPFNKKVSITAIALATNPEGKTHKKWTKKAFVFVLPSSNSCQIGEVIQASGKEPELPGDEISFASLSGFSLLTVKKSDNGNLKAGFVFDDDASIQRVDVFYQIGDTINQATYNNVTEGQSLGNVPLINDYEWFNYFDSDGSVSNISTLNQFNQEIILPPPNPKTPKPKYFKNAKLTDVLSASEKSIALTVSAQKDADIPDTVTFKYSVNGGNQKQVEMTLIGDEYVASLGSFDGEFDIAPQRVEGIGEKGMQAVYLLDGWYSLTQAEELSCQELCGDNTDNDNDGLVDEDCVLLPELFFLNKNIPFYSISQTPVKADVTVKNSGVANAPNFTINFYLNNELVDSEIVPGLNSNESQKVFFEAPYMESYEGTTTAKVVIDESNEVPELVEINNIYIQDIIVGPNFFEVELNYNKTDFPADNRQVRVRDGNFRVVDDATVTITLPSGQIITKVTDSEGLVEFALGQAGTYNVEIEKGDFIPFNGKFGVAKLIIPGLESIVPIGSEQNLVVVNTENNKLVSGTLELSYPDGKTEQFDLSSEEPIKVDALQRGKHEIKVIRNQITVLRVDFVATESIGTAVLLSDFAELIFGQIINTPVLFIYLLFIAILSALIAYSKSKMFFKKKSKGSTQKRREQAIRIGIAVIYLLAPFQVARMFDFNVALIFVFLDIMALLFVEYYTKSLFGGKKAIKV